MSRSKETYRRTTLARAHAQFCINLGRQKLAPAKTKHNLLKGAHKNKAKCLKQALKKIHKMKARKLRHDADHEARKLKQNPSRQEKIRWAMGRIHGKKIKS